MTMLLLLESALTAVFELVASTQGDIEKTDELLLSDEPEEPEARKRKVKPKQGKGSSPSKGGVKSMLRVTLLTCICIPECT